MLANNGDPFRPEQRPLHIFVPTVAAQQAPRRDDTVAGHPPGGAAFHDVSDGPGGARLAGNGGDIAVRRDLSWWDALYGGKHALLKGGH